MSVSRATGRGRNRTGAVTTPPLLAAPVVRGLVAEILGDRAGGRARADLTLLVNICAGELGQVLRAQTPVSGSALARIETVAARWAQLDLPVEPLQHAVHAGIGTAFQQLAPTLPWSTVRTARGNGIALIDIIRTMSTAVSRGYVREIRALAAEQRAVVQTVTARLLAGNVAGASASGDIEIADTYRVLAVALGPHPDEHDRRLDARVVARRKLRRVQAELAIACGPGVLTQLSVDGGTLLLPPAATGDPDDLVARLARAAAGPVTVAMADADRDRIPPAVELAHELLDLAVRLGRGPGLYRFEDLACEYQLGRPGTANEKIRSVLAPLQTEPELEHMLGEFLAAGGRAATAQRLGVPVGVLRRRLARITELTGLDPSRATDLWYLRSSMIARAIHRSVHGDDPDSQLDRAV
ncbi:helix-turn-helix domain-containing protein [Nocardia sp. BMG111209]|uniref:helix-turn-helix domain-containing protein n=1 Tax=Nocardia sp. BMG111209 TaxID=1160137 RepID=UPI00039D2CB6|nr:helix-turn-helix domain-containing protein [Nocardia sp. BMG111209]